MARSLLALVLVAGCGFSLQTGSGDDQVPEGRPISIIDDVADDFLGTTSDSTIATRGSIEPDAFVVSGLHARAYSGDYPTGATYTVATSNLGTQLGEGYHQVPFRFDGAGADHPHGIGIGVGGFSIVYDGEIRLPAGPVMIDLACDDSCAVELMLDGTTWTDSMIATYNSNNAMRTFDVPADGWYPIRAAFEQGCCSSYFDIHFTPAGGTRTHVDQSLTRARVTNTPGLLVEAFQVRAMARSLGTTAVQTVDHDFGYGAPPFDLDMPINDWTLRYLGQLRIDEPGIYTFSADSSTGGSNGGDLWRIWIDGTPIAGPWVAPPSTTATIMLEPGWHDFGVDFGDDDNQAEIQARMSGPGIPDGPIAASRLRPAVATGLTSMFADIQNRTQIRDATTTAPTQTSISAVVPGAMGEKVVSIDWGLGFEFVRMEDLAVTRADCTSTGTPVPIGTLTGYYYYPTDTTCAGVDLPLDWKYVVTDSVNGGNQGNVWNPLVTVTYRGGEKNRPFPDEAVFTSSIRETPNAIGYGRVKLDAALRGGGVKLEVRTGADAASIESAPWVEVADDEVPAVEPGAVLQYRVTLLTRGWELVSVDRVEIVYVVPE